MDEDWQYRSRISVTERGPLPEVMETNRETLWKMFVELDEQHTAGFLKTEPSTLAARSRHTGRSGQAMTVQAVMAEARRNNRVCPVEAEWQRLHQLLLAAGGDAPAPLTGSELRRTAPLARRIRLRDQVEWAAQHGLLGDTLKFITALPEEHWLHMGD